MAPARPWCPKLGSKFCLGAPSLEHRTVPALPEKLWVSPCSQPRVPLLPPGVVPEPASEMAQAGAVRPDAAGPDPLLHRLRAAPAHPR